MRRLPTVDDGTDDLVDLAVPGGLARGKALGDGRRKGVGLKGTLDRGPGNACRWAGEPGDAAAKC